MSLLLNTLILSLRVPAPKAAVSGDDFVTEVTGLGFAPYVVDVDSSGRVFVQGENDVWRSLDQGITWTKVLDGATTTNRPRTIFVDSRDYVYALIWRTRFNYYLYRSTDNGDSWIEIQDDIIIPWHMAEDNNGNLYLNSYSTVGADYVYRSTDSGASFSVWYNVTGQDDHIHTVGVDIANDDIYMAMGDTVELIQRWNGASWSNITTGAESGNEAQPTDIWSDGSYVYFAPDGQTILYRIPSGGTWSQKEFLMDFGYHGTAANFVFEAVRYADSVTLLGTEDGQLWGTWDGLRYVKLMDTGNDADSFLSISNRRPIYVVERTNGKLYRINIQKEDLIRLYYSEYNLRRGLETNAESYVLEQRLRNGTNQIDLTRVALSNVQGSIKGLSKKNELNDNAGFEWNNKTGWTESGQPASSITSVAGEVANGTYAYKIIKGVGDTSEKFLFTQGFAIKRGDIVVLSVYSKGNQTGTNALGLYFCNVTTPLEYSTHTVTTSWQRFTNYYWLTTADTLNDLRIRITFKKVTVTHYIDSVLVEKLAVGMAYRNGRTDNAISDLEGDTKSLQVASPYFTGSINTTNPTLTINSETISHSGTLTNGTESSATSLSGILTGAVQVSANIQGSGQAILRLTGTRVLYEDSIILQGRTDEVYHGRYYGTFSPTTNTNDLVAVTNLASSITSLSYASNKLTLTIDSPTGTTSTTKVFCGIRGEPIAIYTANGTLTWSYNTSTTILTLNVTHASPTRILVYWKFPGDIDNDGDVDYDDFIIIAGAYGTCEGDPFYMPEADLDGDGCVDYDDFSILAGDYGKTRLYF